MFRLRQIEVQLNMIGKYGNICLNTNDFFVSGYYLNMVGWESNESKKAYDHGYDLGIITVLKKRNCCWEGVFIAQGIQLVVKIIEWDWKLALTITHKVLMRGALNF